MADERTSHVARNSSVMFMGSLGSRALGFVRTALFALCVSASLAGDAFQVANTLPTQIYVLISSGLLTAVLIPQITKAMKRADGGKDFVDRLITLSLLILGGATVLFTLLVPALITLLSSGTEITRPQNQAALQLAILFGYWCMPQLLFYGIYAVLGQVLNARGKFGAYAWAPAWANVVQIIGLIAFYVMWGYQPNPGTWSPAMVAVLGGSTTLGIAIQGLCLVPALRKDGFSYTPRFGWRGYGFGAVSRMAAWTFAAVGISQVGGFVSTWAMLGARSGAPDVAGPTAQQYAYTLFILPHSLITVSIVTALFPALSRAWQDADVAGLRKLLRQGLAMPAVTVIPASIALCTIGVPVVRTLFMALSIREARDVAVVLAAYSVGTLAFGITALKQRYCFAREDGALNFWLVALLTVIQMGFSVLAVYVVPPRFGVATVGLGHSVGSVVSAIVFLLIATRQLGGLGMSSVVRLWLRLTLASVLAGGIGWATVWAMDQISVARLFQPLTLMASGLAFCLVFWVAARVLRITEVDDLFNGLVRRARGLIRRR